MSRYYGDFQPGKVVRCRFNTATSAGVPTSLTGGAVIVSKDGADVTPSGGVTLAVDVGGVTGRNHVIIDMSVDTTTFTAGSEYAVRLSGSSAVGATSWVGVVVGEWSVTNRFANANVIQFAGVSTYPYDGILAGATSTTVSFPVTDAAGNSIPDDGRFAHTQIEIVGGTGMGQMLILGDRTAIPMEYKVLPGTMPRQCDNTSQYVNRGSIVGELNLAQPVPLTNTPHTVGDSLNAARAQGFGKLDWPEGSNMLTLYASDGTTPVHTFTLDDPEAPRERS